MTHTSETKALLFRIEKTRQSLEHLVRIGDTTRSAGLLIALNAMYTELVEITRRNEARRQASRLDDFRLVFSDQHPNGRIMTQIEYIQLTKRMVRDDRETHIVVDVDPEAVSQMATIIDLDTERTARKRAKWHSFPIL